MDRVRTLLRTWAVKNYLTRFATAPESNPAWQIAPGSLDHISIRWPREYEWNGASDWVDVLKIGLSKFIPVQTVDDIPQPHKGTVVFELIRGGTRYPVAIGYSDYLALDEQCANGCRPYFKMQYDKSGYGRRNVVPGGFVPDGKRLYFYLRRLRRSRDEKNYLYDVNARFSLNYSPDVRAAAVELLSRQNSFSFRGGLDTVSYLEFLKEIARSKICIDLPGLGPFCFRLMNYLAIGSCIIAYPHKSTLHVPLVDREHIVFCKEDLSDLTDLCEYYLENDAERERIAMNARRFFDRNLHVDNLARYYLTTCLGVLSG